MTTQNKRRWHIGDFVFYVNPHLSDSMATNGGCITKIESVLATMGCDYETNYAIFYYVDHSPYPLKYDEVFATKDKADEKLDEIVMG